jgi:hypothetical protein
MYPTTFSYLHILWTLDAMSHVTNSWCHVTCYELLMPCYMLQTLDTMSTNSMKNNIALIILQCWSIATCCKCNHLCNHSMHGHNKNKNHQYLVLCSFIACSKRKKERKIYKIKKNHWKKCKKRPKVNLILSHVNHTFLILDPWMDPMP